MLNKNERLEMTRLEWGVVVSLVASAGSIVFSAGVIWQTVQVHERAITLLQSQRDDTIDRLARLETKIDQLLEQKKEVR